MHVYILRPHSYSDMVLIRERLLQKGCWKDFVGIGGRVLPHQIAHP